MAHSAGEGSLKAGYRLVKEPATDQDCEWEAWGSLDVRYRKCGPAVSTEFLYHSVYRERDPRKDPAVVYCFPHRKGPYFLSPFLDDSILGL